MLAVKHYNRIEYIRMASYFLIKEKIRNSQPVYLNNCCNHPYKFLVSEEGIEPSPHVPKTRTLPLRYSEWFSFFIRCQSVTAF